MAHWTEVYRARVVGPTRAVELVSPQDTIALGGSNAEPRAVARAIVERAEQVAGLTVLQWPGGFASTLDVPEAGGLCRRLDVPNRHSEEALRDGRAQYVPGQLHATLRRIADGRLPVHGAVVQVTPPDDQGFCSLGTSVISMRPCVDAAGYVVAEVNEQMPRTSGDARVHVSRFDAIVEHDHPIPELPRPEIGPKARALADNVASLIPDRAVVQVGIGSMPDAVLECLADRDGIRIHSGIIGDGVMDLARRGLLDGGSADDPPIRCGSVLGTRALYDFVAENPMVELRSGLYTHDASVIAQYDRFVSINSALQIDLTGQVNAEELGGQVVAGTGGMLDFARGASASSDGRAILVLPSTAKSGQISRIVATLPLGSPVTMPRTDVQYVVTEHGVAHLEGRSIAERAEALVAIADPRFRTQLADEMTAIRSRS